jgi:hypothetical protein
MGMMKGGMAGANSQQSLSETQKQGLSELLSNYDAANLSDEDAKSLTDGIKELGIQRGKELAQALGDAGFDARALAEQAGLKGSQGQGGPNGGSKGGTPPVDAKGPDSSAVQTLQSVVEQLQDLLEENTEDTDYSAKLTEILEESGLDPSEPILDYRV